MTMLKKLTLILSYTLFTFSLLTSSHYTSASGHTKTKTIHILVALCDNKYQGIVPVPAAIGNGQDPRNNLYWGAAYGLKTYFKKQTDWQLLSSTKNPQPYILERLIYKHKTLPHYVIADAYDGQYIKNTTQDFFKYAQGLESIELSTQTESTTHHIAGGGAADFIIYAGHNGLMDWPVSDVFAPQPSATLSLDTQPEPTSTRLQTQRRAAVFACKSQSYFSQPLVQTGIAPALLTTDFMAPEGYVVFAAVNAYSKNSSLQQLREQVATAYSHYQKLKKPVMRMFTTQYSQ